MGVCIVKVHQHSNGAPYEQETAIEKPVAVNTTKIIGLLIPVAFHSISQ